MNLDLSGSYYAAGQEGGNGRTTQMELSKYDFAGKREEGEGSHAVDRSAGRPS